MFHGHFTCKNHVTGLILNLARAPVYLSSLISAWYLLTSDLSSVDQFHRFTAHARELYLFDVLCRFKCY
jgi:hypothetical protein